MQPITCSRNFAIDTSLAYDRTCMHEFVLSAVRQKALGVRTLDIAKRLLDFGVHPPTTYFPLIVPEALMIEPTGDRIEGIARLLSSARCCRSRTRLRTIRKSSPRAPHNTEYKRLDDVTANRNLNLRWLPEAAPELVGAAAD